MMFETSPIVDGLAPDAQRALDKFHAYLHTPDRLFDTESEQIILNAMSDPELCTINLEIFEDRFSEVLGNFCKTIWVQGLYAIINASVHAKLTSEHDGVEISTQVSAGRILIKLNYSEYAENQNKHILFISAEDDPMNIAIQTQYGTMNDFLDLIHLGSKRFESLLVDQSVMHPVKL